MYQLETIKDRKKAKIKTNHGVITIQLFENEAPKAVENFVTHAKNGYYNGLTFHRVIRDFMIQGGDPEGTGAGGESIWKKPFEDECNEKLHHFKGALSMANAGPNTNGSQFFIVQMSSISPDHYDYLDKAGYDEETIETYKKRGGTFWLDGKHTVFGQVIDGLEIVDQIAELKTDPFDKPFEDVIIDEITIEE